MEHFTEVPSCRITATIAPILLKLQCIWPEGQNLLGKLSNPRYSKALFGGLHCDCANWPL